MKSTVIQKNENKLLDVFKYFSALFILASHCLPLVPNHYINFFYGQWFFRFCVPFFIISSGYFFASFNMKGKLKYLQRIAFIYILSSLLYLPSYMNGYIKTVIHQLVFGYIHLWYLSALTISLCIYYLFDCLPLIRRIFNKLYPYIAVILLVIGAYFDEYKCVFADFANIPAINRIGDFIQLIGGPRHALFFVFPMLLIGKFIFDYKDKLKLKKRTYIILTLVSFGVSFAECVMLRHYGGTGITCDVTLFNYFPAVFLFLLTFTYQPKLLKNIQTRALRKYADIIYLFHMQLVFIVDALFDVTYVSRFLFVLLFSIIVSWLYLKVTDEKNIALYKRRED